MDVTLRPIGTVRGGRVDPVDDGWGSEVSTIELDPRRLDADALVGLDEFSHVEVVYLFHLVDEADVVTGARRPRGRPDWPEVGILAQRGRIRPNRLGVSVADIVEVGSYTVVVRGLDAVDGSPVLDLKPYLRGFAPRGEVVEPRWATEIMAGYWEAAEDRTGA